MQFPDHYTLREGDYTPLVEEACEIITKIPMNLSDNEKNPHRCRSVD